MEPTPEQSVWTIGRWRFDASCGSLADGGDVRRLEHRAAATLAVLCRRRGHVVSRQDLLDEVWGGRSVSANSVAVVIADIRRALDENAKAPTLVMTMAKRGYRLAPAPEPQLSKPAAPQRRLRPALAAGAAVAALLTAVVLVGHHPGRPGAVLIGVGPVRNETGLAQDADLAASLQTLLVDQLAHDPSIAVVEQAAPSRIGAQSPLALSSKLVLWNGLPTIHMLVTEPETGRVFWSGMAVAASDQIASATIDRLGELRRRLRSRARAAPNSPAT